MDETSKAWVTSKIADIEKEIKDAQEVIQKLQANLQRARDFILMKQGAVLELRALLAGKPKPEVEQPPTKEEADAPAVVPG